MWKIECMKKSLKDQNKLMLFGLISLNLAIFYLVVQGNTIIIGDWSSVILDLDAALPAGIGLALIGIINGLFSANAKARIVFMRWDDPLPGSEAFSRYADTDPRVDMETLNREHGTLPTDPRQQNSLWYRLYKSVESDPSIMQVHREFLFSRDYTSLALMMVVLLGAAGFIQISTTWMAWGYLAWLLLQFILAGRAARQHGKRFVTTVLALKGAGR